MLGLWLGEEAAEDSAAEGTAGLVTRAASRNRLAKDTIPKGIFIPGKLKASIHHVTLKNDLPLSPQRQRSIIAARRWMAAPFFRVPESTLRLESRLTAGRNVRKSTALK